MDQPKTKPLAEMTSKEIRADIEQKKTAHKAEIKTLSALADALEAQGK